MLSSHLTAASPMSQGKQSGWTYLRMRNNLRAVLQPQAEALQMTALLFRSDELQSHRDQVRTAPPRGPRRILKGAGFPLGAGLSLGAVGSKGALCPWLSGNLMVMQADSQLQELGAAALKPWAGLPGGGSPAGAPVSSLSPETLAPRRRLTTRDSKSRDCQHTQPSAQLSEPAAPPGRLLPCTALPHRGGLPGPRASSDMEG